MFWKNSNHIYVGFINQLERTMKIVVCKCEFLKMKHIFQESCNNF